MSFVRNTYQVFQSMYFSKTAPISVEKFPSRHTKYMTFSNSWHFRIFNQLIFVGASIDRPDQPPVVEECETNVDMCPNHDDTTGERPRLKKMLSLENSKEKAKQIKRVSIFYQYELLVQELISTMILPRFKAHFGKFCEPKLWLSLTKLPSDFFFIKYFSLMK